MCAAALRAGTGEWHSSRHHAHQSPCLHASGSALLQLHERYEGESILSCACASEIVHDRGGMLLIGSSVGLQERHPALRWPRLQRGAAPALLRRGRHPGWRLAVRRLRSRRASRGAPLSAVPCHRGRPAQGGWLWPCEAAPR